MGVGTGVAGWRSERMPSSCTTVALPLNTVMSAVPTRASSAAPGSASTSTDTWTLPLMPEGVNTACRPSSLVVRVPRVLSETDQAGTEPSRSTILPKLSRKFTLKVTTWSLRATIDMETPSMVSPSVIETLRDKEATLLPPPHNFRPWQIIRKSHCQKFRIT